MQLRSTTCFDVLLVTTPQEVSTRGAGHLDKDAYDKLRGKLSDSSACDADDPKPRKRPAAAIADKPPSKRALAALLDAADDDDDKKNEISLDDDAKTQKSNPRHKLTPDEVAMKGLRAFVSKAGKLAYDAKLRVTQLGKACLRLQLSNFIKLCICVHML